jgi:hypothetical protein
MLPTLLRLPMVMFDNWKNIDVTPWSCLAATVALVAKLYGADCRVWRWAVWMMVAVSTAGT